MATIEHVSRRSLLTASAAALAGTAVVPSGFAAEPDPIFALIEKHRAAVTAD